MVVFIHMCVCLRFDLFICFSLGKVSVSVAHVRGFVVELGDLEYLLMGVEKRQQGGLRYSGFDMDMMCMRDSDNLSGDGLVDLRDPFLGLWRRGGFLLFIPESRLVGWPGAEVPGLDEEAARVKLLAYTFLRLMLSRIGNI